MNFYKRHIGDYIKDAAHLSLLEHGVYARLMDVYYTREAGIPDGQANRLIGARSKDEQQAVQNVLAEFFSLVDGVWIQSRCEREIEAASAKGEQNRENGKKGGRPRKNPSLTEPTKNPDGFEEENPDGFQTGSEKNLSQTPDTRHQTEGQQHNHGGQSRALHADGELPERHVQVAVLLRSLGVTPITGQHPLAMVFANAGATDAQLRAAVEIARERKPVPQPISPAYLQPILQDVLNPPQPKPQAHRPPPLHAMSDTQLNAEGRRVGAGEARMGETRPEYIARIQTAMAAAQGRATA